MFAPVSDGRGPLTCERVNARGCDVAGSWAGYKRRGETMRTMRPWTYDEWMDRAQEYVVEFDKARADGASGDQVIALIRAAQFSFEAGREIRIRMEREETSEQRRAKLEASAAKKKSRAKSVYDD